MADQQTAGYACEFVEEVKELQTECSICLHVLRDPHMVECCGYRFCGGCIKSVLREFNACPLCNSKQPRTVADKQLSRSLKEKKVRCTHREDGCKWVGELAALDEHLELTRRTAQGCSNSKLILCKYCHVSYLRSFLEAHESKCLKRPIICKYCNLFQCLRHELAEHLAVCDHYPVVCHKGCGVTVTRKSLDNHIRNWCSFTIVECDYAYAGCDVKMPRKDMKDHVEQAMKEHLALLTMKFSVLKIEHEREQERTRGIVHSLTVALDRQKEKTRELENELVKVKRESETSTDEVHLLKRLCEKIQAEDKFNTGEDQVIIANLPWRTTEQMIKSLFGQHGAIYAVSVYHDNGYNGPIAVVEYEGNESVQAMFHKYNSVGIRLLGYQLKVTMCPLGILRRID